MRIENATGDMQEVLQCGGIPMPCKENVGILSGQRSQSIRTSAMCTSVLPVCNYVTFDVPLSFKSRSFACSSVSSLNRAHSQAASSWTSPGFRKLLHKTGLILNADKRATVFFRLQCSERGHKFKEISGVNKELKLQDKSIHFLLCFFFLTTLYLLLNYYLLYYF